MVWGAIYKVETSAKRENGKITCLMDLGLKLGLMGESTKENSETVFLTAEELNFPLMKK